MRCEHLSFLNHKLHNYTFLILVSCIRTTLFFSLKRHPSHNYLGVRKHCIVRTLTTLVALVSDTKPSLSSIIASSTWATFPSICKQVVLLHYVECSTWNSERFSFVKTCSQNIRHETLTTFARMLLIRLLWWIFESMLCKEKESRKSFKHNPKLKLIASFILSFSLNFIWTWV